MFPESVERKEVVMSDPKGLKTIVITGCSSGLGLECVKAILSRAEPWNIVMACRDLAKTEKLAAELGQTPNLKSRLIPRELDLSSLGSVRNFTSTLNCHQIDVLVCNAGVQSAGTTKYTKDGFEETFGVNHLGHFLLINLLLARLSDEGRVILVASGTHDPAVRTGMPAPAPLDPQFRERFTNPT